MNLQYRDFNLDHEHEDDQEHEQDHDREHDLNLDRFTGENEHEHD